MQGPRYHLPVILPWGQIHPNDVFRHEMRSKADVEAYFNGLGGAGTVIFYGTEGVDYEFSSQYGFRTLTNGGALEIVLSKILSAAESKNFCESGYSLEWQSQTDQWVEPKSTPYTLIRDNPYMQGAAAGALQNAVLVNIYTNNLNSALSSILVDDSASQHTKGRNRLVFSSGGGANQAAIARPITSYNKGDCITYRVSAFGAAIQAWIDAIPVDALHGGSSSTSPGTHGSWGYATSNYIFPHTANAFRLFIGNRRQLDRACTRWVRNLRLWNTHTSHLSTHPMLARVFSFGDSYSADLLGTTAPVESQLNGINAWPGGYQQNYFADIDAGLRFAQLLYAADYGIGSMGGAGQGGKAFSSTLDSEGWRQQFITAHPSMAFTFWMHNDVAPVHTGSITIEALRTKLIDDYLLPVFARGCYGWGFVVAPISSINATAGYTAAHDAIADMLIGLPSYFDALHPEYAGRVKVRDIRGTMTTDYESDPLWQAYWYSAAIEPTHPSALGQYLAGEMFADMALEWLEGACTS